MFDVNNKYCKIVVNKNVVVQSISDIKNSLDVKKIMLVLGSLMFC